jgi:hypothetical protein
MPSCGSGRGEAGDSRMVLVLIVVRLNPGGGFVPGREAKRAFPAAERAGTQSAPRQGHRATPGSVSQAITDRGAPAARAAWARPARRGRAAPRGGRSPAWTATETWRRPWPSRPPRSARGCGSASASCRRPRGSPLPGAAPRWRTGPPPGVVRLAAARGRAPPPGRAAAPRRQRGRAIRRSPDRRADRGRARRRRGRPSVRAIYPGHGRGERTQGMTLTLEPLGPLYEMSRERVRRPAAPAAPPFVPPGDLVVAVDARQADRRPPEPGGADKLTIEVEGGVQDDLPGASPELMRARRAVVDAQWAALAELQASARSPATRGPSVSSTSRNASAADPFRPRPSQGRIGRPWPLAHNGRQRAQSRLRTRNAAERAARAAAEGTRTLEPWNGEPRADHVICASSTNVVAGDAAGIVSRNLSPIRQI